MNNDNFFSIDKLVEFGMTISIAQQMIQSMNYSIDNSKVSGSMNKFVEKHILYFIILNGKQVGPISEYELSKYITDKKVNTETYIWHNGLSSWKKAKELPEVLKIVALSPPPFAIIDSSD